LKERTSFSTWNQLCFGPKAKRSVEEAVLEEYEGRDKNGFECRKRKKELTFSINAKLLDNPNTHSSCPSGKSRNTPSASKF
jgi:hypothetical protein